MQYLGYQISAAGIGTAKEKVQAVLKAPTPTNTGELQSFLGLVNYYGRFISNLASICNPLNCLLQKSAVWRW